MNRHRRYLLLLIVFFLLAYVLPLGFRSLAIPDEARYAEIPREMLATGDWVVPRLDGLRYFEKPALGYWVHAGSIALFGENAFAVRLPSALAVGLSALLIYLLLRTPRIQRITGEENFPAVIASLAFLSCFEVFGVGNTAVLDSLFAFLLTATITLFFFATEAQAESWQERGLLILAGTFCGLAFLTKGFLALAIPVLALVPYLIWQRRYSDLLRMSWLPILTAVLVSLPWGILIQLRAPDFWHYFFWNEHVRRFLAKNAQHKESFWYFFMGAPAMFMPWIPLLPAAVTGLISTDREDDRMKRLIRLALCWLILPFLLFSASKGKLLTYILPCFPPFALLVGIGLWHYLKKEEGKKLLFRAGTIVNAVLFGVLLIAFLFLQHRRFDAIPLYTTFWQPALAAVGFLVLIALYVQASKSRPAASKIFFFGCAPLLLFFLLNFLIPAPTGEAKMPGPLIERHRQQIAPGDLVIADENLLRAVCWYLRRDDVYVLGSPGELKYGLGYPDASGRLLDMPAAIGLIQQHPGKVVLIGRAELLAPWMDKLPKPALRDTSRYGRNVILKF